jgi:hypothetical protein
MELRRCGGLYGELRLAAVVMNLVGEIEPTHGDAEQDRSVIVRLRVWIEVPVSIRCSWNRRTSSTVVVSGDRFSQAANRLQATPPATPALNWLSAERKASVTVVWYTHWREKLGNYLG